MYKNGKPELCWQITSSDFQDCNFGTIHSPSKYRGAEATPPNFLKFELRTSPPQKNGDLEATKKSKRNGSLSPKNVIKHATPILNELKKVLLGYEVTTILLI